VEVIGGFGFVLDSTVGPIDDSGLRYNISVGSFISTNDEGNSSSYLEAGLGQFSGTSMNISQEFSPLENLSGSIADGTVWPDKPVVNVAIQARDGSLSTRVRLEVNVTLSSSSGMQVSNSCGISPPSGICTVSIEVPQSWFSDSVQNISVSVAGETEDIEGGSAPPLA